MSKSNIGSGVGLFCHNIGKYRVNTNSFDFSNPIRPKKFEKVLLEYLKEPLKDISISRPKDRVSWAIPTPDDETQTVYVWLDALVNYLTCAGYPDATVS